ncbi:MAG TPA: hypothetical protein VGO47_10035, partial [Chlamydiales bacterium]|nr:hypothetical protein [Chlamydiales bacterium]
RLYQVIVPDHLEFRHIRCDTRKKDLWERLCQKPGLAGSMPHGIGNLFRAIDNLLSPLKELQLMQQIICHTGKVMVAPTQACPVSDFR